MYLDNTNIYKLVTKNKQQQQQQQQQKHFFKSTNLPSNLI